MQKVLVGLLAAWLVGAGLASGQSGDEYELNWSTIDGGGGVSNGGPYTMAVTIAQPDAGYQAGGDFELFGGFWPGAIPYAYTCWDAGQCAGQPEGDATCDGNVNLADLFALKAHFGKCAPWTDPECCADSTQDGCINLADLFVFKAGFGADGYTPSTGNQDCPR
jgi:hypothetical protein